MRGLPDWHHPIAGGAAYAAYEQPGCWYASPTRLVPVRSAAVEVDRYSQDRGGAGGIVHYGVHTLRWDAVPDEPPAALAALLPGAHPVVRPLPLMGGSVRLTAPELLVSSDPAAPTLGQSMPLDQAGLASFVATLTLDATSTDLVVDAYRGGIALIGAEAVLAATGVAARHRAVVELDVDTLLATVAALDGAAGAGGAVGVEVSTLLELFATDPASAGVEFVSGAPDGEPDRREAAAALVDRVVTLGAPTPLETVGGVRQWAPTSPPRVTLRAVAGAGARLRWALEDPVPARRYLALASSPLAPDHLTDVIVVREHRPPALASGRHRLSIATTIAAPWAGAAIGYEVVVPPAPPFRMQPAGTSGFFSDEPRTQAELRLGPLEPLIGTVRGVVLFDSGADTVAGERRPLTQEAVVLRADDFPAQLLPVSLALDLHRYRVEVRVFADDPTGLELAGATLGARDAGGPGASEVTLVVPVGPVVLVAEASSPDGRTATSDPLPAGTRLIDVFSFPGTGSQVVRITVDFGTSFGSSGVGAPAVVIDVVPEDRVDDSTAVTTLALTPRRPTVDWTRFVASPFATGFRWRRAGGAQWSDVIHARDGWTITAASLIDPPPEIDVLEEASP